MNKAQEVRHNRLMQRELAKEHIPLYPSNFYLDINSAIIFNWILNLFTSPQRYNTFDVVILSEKNGMIFISDTYETGYEWNSKLMLLVASMFEKEKGYLVQHFEGENGCNKVIIEIA